MSSRKWPSRRSLSERNALVMQWEGLPHFVAVGMWRTKRVRNMDFDDAVQAGFLGLIRAAELFDESKGVKFVTYACHCCRRAITKADHDVRAIRVPEYVYQLDDPGEMPNLVTSQEDIVYLLGKDLPEGQGDDERALVRRAVAELPNPRLRYVIKRLYLDGDNPTLKVVGSEIGVTREYVRQLRNQAIGLLRERLASTSLAQQA